MEEKLKKVGVRELRADIAKFLGGDMPFEVVRHGHTVGYYFPVQQKSKQKEIEALVSVAEKCQALINELNLNEDDLVAEFDQLRKAEKRKSQ